MIFKKLNVTSEKLVSVEKGTYTKAIYDLATGILKENFFRFFNLYYESLTSGEYQYVVLVTRRAYVLYEIFLLCMKELGVPKSICSKIITSDAIYMIGYGEKNKDEYKNAKFLILDDIIINGRTILSVYKRLKELGVNKISVASMEMYEDAKFLYHIDTNCIKEIPQVSEKIWKRDSDALTNLIISCNIGYTSFVSSYIFEQYSVNDWNEMIEIFKQNNITLKDIQSEALQQNGIKAKAFFFDSEDKEKLNLADNKKLQICMRLYYSENNKSLTVIPYCFFENVIVKECAHFCNQMLFKSGYGFSQVILDFINKNEQYALLYKYTINHISKNAFDVFRDSFYSQLKGKSMYIKFPEEYYFNNKKWIEKTDNILSTPMEKIEIKIDDDKYYYNYAYNCFLSTVDEKQSARTNLLSFLNSIKSFDDKNAQDSECVNRCVGIRILDIYDIFSKKNIENKYQTILLMIVGLWDDGTAAYNYSNVECKDGEEAICGFLKNGEQIYNKIYLLYPDVYSYFYRLYNKASIYRFHNLEQFAHFMKEHTNNFDFIVLLNEIKKGSEEHYYSDLGCVAPDQICHKWDDTYNKYLDENIYKKIYK